jgi:polyhydroxybutyrate depolymerase
MAKACKVVLFFCLMIKLPGIYGLPSPALAQSTSPGGQFRDRFKQLDRDGDGKLSREELARMSGLERVLSVADSDKDGFLTLQELQAYRNQLAAKHSPSATAPADAPYAQTEHRLVVDGRERTYIVQAPKESRGLLPVVFVFHGGGGRGANMANVGFRELVAKKQFLAVYPDGWRGNWNDGRNAPRIISQREGVDDVKFVRAMVDDLANRYPIDRTRVFATGVSNGGIFCHYLAAKAADLFAAVAPVIGGLAEPVATTFKPSHPISLLVIQGDADPLVPINGGPIAGSDRGGRVIATEEMLKKYLAHNGITGPPQLEQLPDRDPRDGTTTEVRRWPPGRDGVRAEYYLVKGGGHTMPGRTPAGVLRETFAGKTSRDFDGLEVIWNFFKSCPPRRPSDSTSEAPLPTEAKP